MENKRSFKVIGMKSGAQAVKGSYKSTTCYEGRYISDTPRGAASKAFSAHCHAKNIRNQCTMVVMIQETTQGSNHKIYQYRAKRKIVNKTVVRAGKEFTFKYENSLKSLRKNPIKKLKQSCRKGGVRKSKRRTKRKSSRRKSSIRKA
jgi:hypothetical protein